MYQYFFFRIDWPLAAKGGADPPASTPGTLNAETQTRYPELRTFNL